jgi:hypothetical protein
LLLAFSLLSPAFTDKNAALRAFEEGKFAKAFRE